MSRELSTVNALTSNFVEMQKSRQFQQEYAAATTQAEVDAVVARYSYLFSGNQDYEHHCSAIFGEWPLWYNPRRQASGLAGATPLRP
jgi:hypothetical protein